MSNVTDFAGFRKNKKSGDSEKPEGPTVLRASLTLGFGDDPVDSVIMGNSGPVLLFSPKHMNRWERLDGREVEAPEKIPFMVFVKEEDVYRISPGGLELDGESVREFLPDHRSLCMFFELSSDGESYIPYKKMPKLFVVLHGRPPSFGDVELFFEPMMYLE
jgi:hypothetical protein